jgi:hypothetical protein
MMMARVAPDNCPTPPPPPPRLPRKTRSVIYRGDKGIGEVDRLPIEEPAIRG